MSSAPPIGPTGPRHLVLAGAGASHRRLVQRLARRPLPSGWQATWLVPADTVLPIARLPAAIAGRVDWAQAGIALAPLAQAAGVRLLLRPAQGLERERRSVLLDRQELLSYDLLSLDAEPMQDRAAIEARVPGAREHALFPCPAAAFATLWPRVQAQPEDRLRSLAVVGNGRLALELAFALRAARPRAAISLVCGERAPAPQPSAPEAVQALLARALRRAAIDVLPRSARAIEPGRLLLDGGAALACDLPLLAIGLRTPAAFGDAADGTPDGAVASAGTPWTVADGDDLLRLPPWPARRLPARIQAELARRAARQPPRPIVGATARWHGLMTGTDRALMWGPRAQLEGRLAHHLLALLSQP